MASDSIRLLQLSQRRKERERESSRMANFKKRVCLAFAELTVTFFYDVLMLLREITGDVRRSLSRWRRV